MTDRRSSETGRRAGIVTLKMVPELPWRIVFCGVVNGADKKLFGADDKPVLILFVLQTTMAGLNFGTKFLLRQRIEGAECALYMVQLLIDN